MVHIKREDVFSLDFTGAITLNVGAQTLSDIDVDLGEEKIFYGISFHIIGITTTSTDFIKMSTFTTTDSNGAFLDLISGIVSYNTYGNVPLAQDYSKFGGKGIFVPDGLITISPYIQIHSAVPEVWGYYVYVNKGRY